MYGIVNKAIEQLALETGGATLWNQIREKAGFDEPTFVLTEAYSDEVTFRLVGAASEILDVPVDALLEQFGQHWIRYTAERGYGSLLTMTGSTIPEFLQNVESLHARMQLVMPQLQAPELRCYDVAVDAQGNGSLRLRYRSHRPGLAPMVAGIVRGLGTRLRNDVDVTHTVRRAETGGDFDEFAVRFAPRAA